MLDFLVIFLIVLLIWNWWLCDPLHWLGKGIPYSLPWPIVGNVSRALYTPLHKMWMQIYKETGKYPLYGLHIFGSPAIVVNDPDLTKKMLISDGDYFLSHGFHSDQSHDSLGKGLFFADCEQWRETRQKLTPYFTPSRIKSTVNIVKPIAGTFAEVVGREGRSGPIDIFALCHQLTTDSIVSTAFGIEPDCLTNPDSFFTGLNKLFGFNFVMKILLSSLFPWLYDFFKITLIPGYYNEKIKVGLRKVINSRSRGIGVRPDFLQGMVELLQKNDQKDNSDQNNSEGTKVAKFDEDGVMAQCIMLYVAGSDTTAATLASLFYELALNQTVQERARTEIQAMLERSGGAYNYGEIMSLTYTNSAIDEAMRKYSALPVLPRKCTKTYDLDGVRIDKDVLVYFNMTGIQRDPEYFTNPEEFIPERFTSQEIKTGSFFPFGMGSRACIGLKFARVILLLGVCKVLTEYRLSPSSKTKIPMQNALSATLAPKELWLQVQDLDED